MSSGSVLVLGDLMRDIVVRLDGPLRRGTDRRAAITAMPGGSAANLAAWLAYDKVPVRLLASVGREDAVAERERLATLGVDALLIPHETLPTGTLIALVECDGERSFLTDRGANDGLRRAHLPAGVLDDVTHLHVSGYAFVGATTRATARDLIGRAQRRGIPVSLDPGSAGFIADLGAAALLRWCEGATLCVVNESEAEALTGTPDLDRQLVALGAKFELAVLKRGARGAIAQRRGSSRWESTAPAVAVRDTIGAGDAFMAGFLAAQIAGATDQACLVSAVAQGSLAATLTGGLPPSAS